MPRMPKRKPMKIAKVGRKRADRDEGVVSKVKRRLYEIFKGGKAYSERKYGPNNMGYGGLRPLKKKVKPSKKKMKHTVRTKAISGGLKRAGVSKKKISKLRGEY